MTATLKDVAERAKVSPSLVSHALNNKPYARVSAETKLRIQQAAQELNYYPNAVARGLSRKRMNIVGVVLMEGFRSPLSSPYFAGVIDGILEAASDARQNVLFSPSQTRRDVKQSVTAHREGLCDGLLLFAQPQISGLLSSVIEARFPCVLIGDTTEDSIGDPSEDSHVSAVDVDNAGACAEIVTLLLQQGHRRIAFLSGEVAHSSSARKEGYLQALTSWGIVPAPTMLPKVDFTIEAVTEVIQCLMHMPSETRPTAICCYNDNIALFVLFALREMGVRVPQDVSVTGFDDIPAATLAGLTTMHQPLGEIGQQALAALLARIRGETVPEGTQLLPVELILRSSVGPAKS